jgi:hypothetical protein
MQFLVPNDFNGNNYHTLTGNFVNYSAPTTYVDGQPVTGKNLTLEQFMEREGYNPSEWAVLPEDVFFDLYQQKQRERFLTGPKKITADDYSEMLNVLLPRS